MKHIEQKWSLKKKKQLYPVVLRKERTGEIPVPAELRHLHYVDLSEGIELLYLLSDALTVGERSLRQMIPDPDDNVSAEMPSVADSLRLGQPDLSGLPSPFDLSEIPAGKVKIAHKDARFQEIEFQVNRFWMAKYPITNTQYWLFINSPDGYNNTSWWDYSDHAIGWRMDNSEPVETGFSGNDRPRTNVTWYETIAFCRWLTVKFQNKWLIRLPTEQEWQWAAQGYGYNVYPWGNEFDPHNANTYESGLRKTTPVTHYERGQSPFGVMDMSGNVLEWCQTFYDKPNLNFWDGESQRVLRGGSFGNDMNGVTTTFRGRALPNMRGYDIGFRIVCFPIE